MKLGTRGSSLALAQANWVAERLPGSEVVVVEGLRSQVEGAGDKGRYVRGVEEALLGGEVDLGVHSAKDVPGEMSENLALRGVPVREEPADAYVGAGASLDDISKGARIGTSSIRRRSQLLALRGDLEITELRGNVDTRLGRLADGDFDGLVLAAAGLHRLGRDSEISFLFSDEQLIPAPGQGALALQARAADDEAAEAAAAISDETALVEFTAERAVATALAASCDTPLGVRARRNAEALELTGYAGLPDGSEWVRDVVRGDADDPVALGRLLAERMAAAGATEILAKAKAAA